MEPIFEYFSIIVNRLQNPLPKTEYGERHHIYPKSCGGTNDKLNIVKLTPEEHYRCHCLLPELFEDDPISHQKMVFAWSLLHSTNDHTEISEEEYGKLKREFAVANSALHKGKRASIETRRKMSAVRKGRPGHLPWNKGRKGCYSEETRKKLSAARSKQENPFKGHTHSEETLQKMRAARKAYWTKRKALNDSSK